MRLSLAAISFASTVFFCSAAMAGQSSSGSAYGGASQPSNQSYGSPNAKCNGYYTCSINNNSVTSMKPEETCRAAGTIVNTGKGYCIWNADCTETCHD